MTGTRRSALKKGRKARFPMLKRWIKRFGVAVVVLITCLWAGAWFFLGEADSKSYQWAQDKVYNASVAMGFSVDDILVEGRVHSDLDVLKALMNIEKGDSIFSFSPQEAKNLIQRVSWVKSARVERRLPNTIYIGIEERQPLALWKSSEGDLNLIDTNGEVIATDDIALFKDLITVYGRDAAAYAPSVLALLHAEPDLQIRVRAARFISARRWDIVLRSGVVLKLPEDGVGIALRRLMDLHDKDLVLDKDIQSIDLRQGAKIVVRTKPGGVEAYKDGFKMEGQI